MKPERFLCGCAVEWDGKKVTANICEFHQNETKKLKLKIDLKVFFLRSGNVFSMGWTS